MDIHALNGKQKLVVILMDFLLLVELTATIYLSHRNEDSMTLTFLKMYLPVCLATILSCKYCIRRLGRKSS